MLETAIPREALRTLYRDHHRWLHGWIRGKLGCSHRAADLAQDTFCRLLESGSATHPRSPRSFLVTVARRLVIDDSRRREVERTYLECCRHTGAIDDLSPERIAEGAQLLDELLRLLAALPAEVRDTFLLRRLDGLSHGEVAARLGISVRTVKRRIAQAYAHCYLFSYGA